MAPEILSIKANLNGAEQSEAILALYKRYRVSPFSGLKGSASLAVQIPILITIFGLTTESAIFREAAFLWMDDLSLPDALFSLPFVIRGLGGGLNALPLLLGIVSVPASYRLRLLNPVGSSSVRWTALRLSLVIVVLFYSFAAALVVYWITVNVV